MGQYINPVDCSKEEFLKEYGSAVSENDIMRLDYDDDNLVCVHVDNGIFTAAIICYCQAEFEYIKRSAKGDSRPTLYYLVERKNLEKFLK